MAVQEKEPVKHHFIIAPHPDDEIIGCYEIINNPANSIAIMYPGEVEQRRKEEALKLREHRGNVSIQMFQLSIPPPMLTDPNITFYFPDPIYEVHPEHRAWGFVGEGMARGGYDVVFYSTLMNTPYIHEADNEYKETLLDLVYPSQKSLWKYEKKFILFEGRCKWLF